MADEVKGRPSALCVMGEREKTYLLIDRPLTFLDVADAVDKHLRNPNSVIFGDAERFDAERFQQLVIGHVEAEGEMTGIYRVDFVGAVASMLDADRGWKVYNLDDVCQAAKSAGPPESVPYEERQKIFDRVLQEDAFTAALPVTLYASRPINERDFFPDDSIEEMDNHLNFYLGTNCDVDALFGTHFDRSDSWLNVYANYDLDTGEVVGVLELTLCRYDGVDIPMRYRLSDDERAMLLTKMRDYCQQCGTPLDEWRAEYLAEREAEATTTVRKTTKQEGENKMSSREISLWIDERWADALEKHLPGHDLQKKMEELLNGLTEQLPEQVREDIHREIRAEDERMEQEREAQRRFSALKVTEDGRDSFLISEGGMNLLNLSGCIRGYLSTDAPFASTLYRVRECDATEFKSALAERADNTGRVVGVFMVDVDAETLSTLGESGDWHEYKFHDLSVAAYAANRKTQQRQERRQEIFAEKLIGKELTPVVETHAPAPMMGQTM